MFSHDFPTIFPWFPLAEARWDDTQWDPTGAGSRTKPQEPAISERGHRYGLDMALYMRLYMDYIGYIIHNMYIYILNIYIYIHIIHYIHYISIHYIYIYMDGIAPMIYIYIYGIRWAIYVIIYVYIWNIWNMELYVGI